MGNASTTLVPGRPGRAVTERPAAPAHTPAGYSPEKLDPQLKGHIAVLERSVRIAERLAKKAEAAVEALEEQPLQGGDETLAEANALTTLHERLTKANLNAVKSLDELSRLRSFLAGGPDSRPELAHRSEIELRALVVQIAPQLGFKLVPVIDTEAYPA